MKFCYIVELLYKVITSEYVMYIAFTLSVQVHSKSFCDIMVDLKKGYYLVIQSTNFAKLYKCQSVIQIILINTIFRVNNDKTNTLVEL